MSARERAAAELIAVGQRLTAAGILASYEGNLSLLLSDQEVLTTPSGVHKGHLTPEQLVRTDRDGRPLSGGAPSSELKMHLAIYQVRPDVRAIAHAHPPIATGYAVAGRSLPAAALAETVSLFGCVPVADYGTPSTEELAAAVRGPAREFDAMLLANHGAVTLGSDIGQAGERMVQLEHFAHIALVSQLLGGPRQLTPGQVDRLSDLRLSAGGTAIPSTCYPSEVESGTITLTPKQLVELIADALRTIR